MRRLLLCGLTLLSTAAAADLLPAEVGLCQSKQAGDKCVTRDGVEGTCQEVSITRPDYGSGIPPKYKQVKMLSCVTPAKGTARSLVPWFGFGLGFLALLLGLWTRRGGGTPPGRPAAA